MHLETYLSLIKEVMNKIIKTLPAKKYKELIDLCKKAAGKFKPFKSVRSSWLGCRVVCRQILLHFKACSGNQDASSNDWCSSNHLDTLLLRHASRWFRRQLHLPRWSKTTWKKWASSKTFNRCYSWVSVWMRSRQWQQLVAAGNQSTSHTCDRCN